MNVNERDSRKLVGTQPFLITSDRNTLRQHGKDMFAATAPFRTGPYGTWANYSGSVVGMAARAIV
jgi:hypothetical protein